jgi:hypothetical protein
MNYFSQAAAFLVAAILLFIAPAYRMYWVIDQASLRQVNVETQNFVNNVRHKGYISKEQYESYITAIAKTGNLYDVQMNHTRKQYYPLQPGDKDYSPTHTYTIINDDYYTKQILDTIYKSGKDYTMKKEDTFTVTVKNMSTTGSMVFLNLLGGRAETGILFSQYGGMIVNENY